MPHAVGFFCCRFFLIRLGFILGSFKIRLICVWRKSPTPRLVRVRVRVTGRVIYTPRRVCCSHNHSRMTGCTMHIGLGRRCLRDALGLAQAVAVEVQNVRDFSFVELQIELPWDLLCLRDFSDPLQAPPRTNTVWIFFLIDLRHVLTHHKNPQSIVVQFLSSRLKSIVKPR